MKQLTKLTLLATTALSLVAPTSIYAIQIDDLSIFNHEAYIVLDQFRETFNTQNLEFSIIDLNTDFSYYSSDLLFEIASITKPFTAIAIMQLVEQGLIDLDSPIINYIPNFRHKENPVTGGDYRNVTVRMLLNHTSGIQNDFLGYEWVTLDEPSANYINNLIENLANHYFLFEPEFSVAYNNNGFNLLGIIIANVTGYENDPFNGYINYIQENILNPLKMTDTTFPTVGLENFAGYYFSANIQAPEELTFFTNVLPTGGIISSPKDMINFMRFLLEGNEEILGNTYREKMLYVPFIEFESGMTTELMNPNMYMGLLHWILPTGNFTIGHNGALAFHFSNMVLDFDTGVGVFSTTNTLSGAQAAIMLAPTLLELKNSVMGYETNLIPITESEPIERSLEELEAYVGLYSVATGFFEVILNDGVLYLELSPDISIELVPLEDGTFSLQGERVRFIEIGDLEAMVIGYFFDQILVKIEPVESNERELSILGRFIPQELSLINSVEIRKHPKGFVYAAFETLQGISSNTIITHFDGNRFLGDGISIIDFEWHGETWWRPYEYISFNFMGVEFKGELVSNE